MLITFVCPSCGAKVRVADRYAGRKAKCPKCNHSLTVPSAAPEQADSASWREEDSPAEAQPAVARPRSAARPKPPPPPASAEADFDDRPPDRPRRTPRRPSPPRHSGSRISCWTVFWIAFAGVALAVIGVPFWIHWKQQAVGRRVVTVGDFQSCQVSEPVTLVGDVKSNADKIVMTTDLAGPGYNAVLVFCERAEIRWFSALKAGDIAPDTRVLVTGTVVEKAVAGPGVGVLLLKECTFRVP